MTLGATSSGSIVYVVDDEPQVLASLAAILSAFHLPHRCYSSAGLFLQDVTADCTGCVIVDLNMPELSGTELHRRLRRINQSLRVIILTGGIDEATEVELGRTGPFTLLQKPIAIESLRRIVTRLRTDSGPSKSNDF